MSNAVRQDAVGARTQRKRFIRELGLELVVGLVTLGALAGTTLRAFHHIGSQQNAPSNAPCDCFEDWPPHA